MEYSQEFLKAKKSAISQPNGTYSRVSYNGVATNYLAYKNDKGDCFVMGDTIEDIKNPNCFINGKPAIKIS